ncbi:MAG: SRPBCC domain-containing protein [Bacteroidetes bacterium]|nr:SRPBCC domain-containing protein [Bacteroidota bacterium]
MPQSAVAEKQKTILVKRTFNLPLKTVWQAWTEPESFKKWWGPKEYSCTHCTIDFKVGGKYLNSMKAADGNEIWSTGVYEEIIPLKKIVYTNCFSDSKGNVVPASDYKMPGEWAMEALVTVEFEEVDGKTNMTLEHEGIPVEIDDDCMKGWQSSFDKLENNLK